MRSVNADLDLRRDLARFPIVAAAIRKARGVEISLMLSVEISLMLSVKASVLRLKNGKIHLGDPLSELNCW
jgi:hypothetical protein